MRVCLVGVRVSGFVRCLAGRRENLGGDLGEVSPQERLTGKVVRVDTWRVMGSYE